jgi:hypothetical protein
MLVLAHAAGDEGVYVTAALGLLGIVGGGMALVLISQRAGGIPRRLKAMLLVSAVLVAAALVWIPARQQTCHTWRDQLLNATSVLVSASGAGTDTPPALTAQDQAAVQQRVRQILAERPFGCI